MEKPLQLVAAVSRDKRPLFPAVIIELDAGSVWELACIGGCRFIFAGLPWQDRDCRSCETKNLRRLGLGTRTWRTFAQVPVSVAERA